MNKAATKAAPVCEAVGRVRGFSRFISSPIFPACPFLLCFFPPLSFDCASLHFNAGSRVLVPMGKMQAMQGKQD